MTVLHGHILTPHGFVQGEIAWDHTKPDGTMLKRMDISRLKGMGWAPRIGLREGIEGAYRWYVANS